MYDEPFLINPPRRKRRKSGGKKRATGRRRRQRGHKSALTALARHRPIVYGSGKRWQRSPFSRSKRLGISINPPLALIGNPRRSRRSYRRNPIALGGLQNQLIEALPLAVTGIASGVVTSMVPGFFNLTSQWVVYGAKTATALLGGKVVDNFAGSDHGLIWTVVGLTSVVQDLVRQYMPGVIPGLSGYPSYYDATSIGAYPNEMGAFTNEQSEYPDSGSYAGMGESPYPY